MYDKLTIANMRVRNGTSSLPDRRASISMISFLSDNIVYSLKFRP